MVGELTETYDLQINIYYKKCQFLNCNASLKKKYLNCICRFSFHISVGKMLKVWFQLVNLNHLPGKIPKSSGCPFKVVVGGGGWVIGTWAGKMWGAGTGGCAPKDGKGLAAGGTAVP